MAAKKKAKQQVPAKQFTPCMTRNCTRNAMRRGVCNACYQAAYREITAGSTSWPELERDGVVLPRQRCPKLSPVTHTIRSKKARPQ